MKFKEKLTNIAKSKTACESCKLHAHSGKKHMLLMQALNYQLIKPMGFALNKRVNNYKIR